MPDQQNSGRFNASSVGVGTREDESSWRLADIRSGIAHIRPGQQELYTPQLLNYDVSGVIDFKKGCYTGQEVVARMYYRAEAKKRLYHVVLPLHETLSAEDVVDSIRIGDTQEVLRIMNRTEAGTGQGVTAFY
jgi:folate-binding protein YgfZ